jgi:hypothetical protein
MTRRHAGSRDSPTKTTVAVFSADEDPMVLRARLRDERERDPGGGEQDVDAA